MGLPLAVRRWMDEAAKGLPIGRHLGNADAGLLTERVQEFSSEARP